MEKSTCRLGLILLVPLAAACQRESPRQPEPVNQTAIVEDAARFRPTPVGIPFEGKPWITHVAAVDLDRDTLVDVLACDAQENAVVFLRQYPRGQFTENVLMSDLPAPVHVAAADLDHDGDLDLLIACMGQIFPTNDRIGAVVVLENDGHQRFTKRILSENTARVTDVEAGDFNNDGLVDLAVGQFGYDQGEVRWLENRGGWNFVSHELLNLAGTVNVCVGNLTGSGRLDIVALVSQQYEEIHLFANEGRGAFSHKVVFGSTNEDFGSSGLSLCDLNRDGLIDLVYTNGDGFDYAEPGARPWHGVQWLENRRDGNFRAHRVGDLPGAYSPVGVDLDEDGDVDIVAVSGFNDWNNPRAASLVWFENDGQQNFSLRVLAHAPTHLVTVAAAEIDGRGAPVLVTGGFHAYPPWDHMSRLLLWRRHQPFPSSAAAPKP